MDYWYTVLSLAGINVILALSVYASFMTGTVSLGQAAFFAIGAFATASCTALLGWHIVPALLVGAAVAAVVGALIAVPTLRLRGLYLTIATVAFVEVVRIVFHNMRYGRVGVFVLGGQQAERPPWIGPDGPLGFRYITYLIDHEITPGEYAAWIGIVVVLACGVFFVLERSRLGYAMRAVEADEAAAKSVGLRIHRIRVGAFAFGAAVAGVGGGLYAHLLTFISGNDFGIPLSVIALAYVVIGGGQTFWGPTIGALIFTFLPELLRFTRDYRLEIFGALMMATMVFRPSGVITRAMVQRVSRLRGSLFPNPRRPRVPLDASTADRLRASATGKEDDVDMRRLGLSLIAATGALLIGSTPADAIWADLTPAQVQEAVDYGMKNFDKHPAAFKWSYYYDAGYGYPNALLRTEYFAIADYVRRSEFQRKYGSQQVHKLTPERIEDARRETAGKLQFIVTLYGETDDLADGFNIHLETANGRKVQPLAADKPVKAAFSGFGGRLDRVATVVVDFPLAQIDPKGTVKLVIVPPPGLGPSGARNGPFALPFNLAELR